MAAEKLRKDLKVYIIGMKGWVEVRVAKVPPKPHVTTCFKSIQVSERCWPKYKIGVGYIPPEQPFRNVNRTITLKAVTWSGGRTICSLAGSKLYRLTRISVKPDTLLELPEKWVKSLTKLEVQ